MTALWKCEPGRLWSLLDMVENFRIGLLRLIQFELHILIAVSDQNQTYVEDNGGYKNKDLLAGPKHTSTLSKTTSEVQLLSKVVEKAFSDLCCIHIDRAISGLQRWADSDEKQWSDLKARAVALREAINNELNEYCYYQYPKSKGQKLRAWNDDWKDAVKAFPSIGRDSFGATDCYAMGYNTASVFHCMRILEYGISALAAELGLSFDIQNWQNIIDQIESKIAEQRKALPRGTEKNQRLQFLSEAAKEFFYFKDGWRNYVSHNRGDYDDSQALSILDHTRSFMLHLSTQLSEQGFS